MNKIDKNEEKENIEQISFEEEMKIEADKINKMCSERDKTDDNSLEWSYKNAEINERILKYRNRGFLNYMEEVKKMRDKFPENDLEQKFLNIHLHQFKEAFDDGKVDQWEKENEKYNKKVEKTKK